MSSNDNGTYGLKIPSFDGEEDKFQKWWLQFQSYAQVKGFRAALEKPGTGYYPDSQEEFLKMSSTDANANIMKKE